MALHGRLGTFSFGWVRMVCIGLLRQARYGRDWPGIVGNGLVRQARLGALRFCMVRCGFVWLGKAGGLWQGPEGTFWSGEV